MSSFMNFIHSHNNEVALYEHELALVQSVTFSRVSTSVCNMLVLRYSTLLYSVSILILLSLSLLFVEPMSKASCQWDSIKCAAWHMN
jgi:hypothetical protein